MARDLKSGLSAAVVALAQKGKLQPGTYSDGRGLMLKVENGGAACWVLRIQKDKKRRDLGLGSLRDVGLADARERAAAKIKEVRSGKNPDEVKPLSFRAAAKAVYDLRTGGWKGDGKHVDQWWSSMENHVLPKLGDKMVGDITAGEMLDVFKSIWHEIPVTPRRLRQRCRLVFNWAVTKNHRSGQYLNPADAFVAALAPQKDETEHFPAVMWEEAPKFLAAVRNSKGKPGTRLALEFLLLTAARTSEALYVEWSEIDIDGRVWTVPAHRMKRGRDHRVALSDEAIAVLETAKALWPNSKIVFGGRWPGEPLSNQALLMLMRRLGFRDYDGRTSVPHGLRSTFRDWCAENGKDDDAAEAALSHTIGNKVQRAYRRTDLLTARGPLMQEWAEYVTGKKAQGASKEEAVAQAA